MTKRQCMQLFKRLYNKYRTEMWIHFEDIEDAYSYVAYREIVMPKKAEKSPTEWDIMAILHEVGHIKTNQEEMPMYKKEYLAVQWSADEAKKIGFAVHDNWKQIYQRYIWSFRRGRMSKERLIINW